MGTRQRAFVTDGRRCASIVMSLYTRVTSTCVKLHRLRRRLDMIARGYRARTTMLGVARMHCGAKLISGLSISRTGSMCCDAGTSVPRLRTNVGRCVAALTVLLNACPRRVHPVLRGPNGLPSCVRPVNVNIPTSLLLHHPSVQRTRHRIGTRTTALNTSRDS